MTAVSAWAAAHLDAWDRQQAAYINRREDRFAIMLDVLAETVPADALVVDLACGPGSISTRVLDRFPRMTCVAVDYDPLLLELGRHALARHGGRLTFREADLWDPAWTEVLDGRRPHAVLSSTALHWLPADVLARVYRDAASVLRPGGVLMNADHLRQPAGRPLFEELGRRDDAATQARDHAAGALSWDAWFAELVAHPHFAPLAPERERRFAPRPPNPDLGLDFHVSALRAAQFAEAGPVWQHLDDYVVLAQR
ncbi:class I SAM-dependent methyltransferase [Cellulomonas triticagri]|uniref:Class I SAM-dependent methyltransferase n=1 Tax=Cellulomonas triticagri TaxID=2483352 RepID=A0A3M2JQA1_9CELL|nr:class I SAM-dependent methyltransferase [Cellulomonas triticagri]RMI12905.1 class I SAM-dependent methyltransferase [Cellulomonas triticagri]